MGDRTATFLALGARVVAVEPQPLCASVLAKRFSDTSVVLVEAGLGPHPGRGSLRLASSHVLASMSPDYVAKTSHSNNEWLDEIDVRVTTLDALVDVFGAPAFCKIDVEGFEADVLAGLTRPIGCLSFEYNPGFRDNAVSCIDRLATLGGYGFAFARGETTGTLEWGDTASARHLAQTSEHWGDFYARLN